MKTFLIIISILVLVALLIVLWVDNLGRKKRFCHHCEIYFLKFELKNTTRCRYCGRELTTFYEGNEVDDEK